METRAEKLVGANTTPLLLPPSCHNELFTMVAWYVGKLEWGSVGVATSMLNVGGRRAGGSWASA